MTDACRNVTSDFLPSNGFSDSFQFQMEPKGNGVVVRLAGSVHMDDCEQLRAELIRLAEKSYRPLVLELSQLAFICSLGLGTLVAAHMQNRQSPGIIRIVSPSPSIRSLLEVTKLTKIFPLYDSVEAALEAN